MNQYPYLLFLGCNLSPLLFSLFISSLGPYLNSSGLGIHLDSQNISCLLFADDLVLVGRTKESLSRLMSMTLGYLSQHRLQLSAKKSKIMAIAKLSSHVKYLLKCNLATRVLCLCTDQAAISVVDFWLVFIRWHGLCLAKCFPVFIIILKKTLK